MPREIKFRAWDEDGHMTYPPFALLDIGDGRPTLIEEGGTLGTHRSAVELMQFTGIGDSTGKEIYEGDVVMLTLTNLKYSREAVVEYRTPEWVLRYKGDFQPLKEWHNYPDRVITIKGNIYENEEASNAIL